MARKSPSAGVLLRHLLGNGKGNPCLPLVHHHRKIVFSSIQTLADPLTSISPTSPQKIAIPSHRKIPLSYYSLHSPSFHLLQHHQRHFSSSGTVSVSPSDVVIVKSESAYRRALTQVKGGRLPAVFHYLLPFSTGAVESAYICKLREKFPHVKIYKIILPFVCKDNSLTWNMNIRSSPTFHFYKNGRKQLDEIAGGQNAEQVIETCEKLYRYVMAVEATELKRLSRVALRGTQRLVIQPKEGENYEPTAGEVKVGSASTLSQQGCPLAEAVASKRKKNTAPSLDQVMGIVTRTPYGFPSTKVLSFAKGLFIGQPEKRRIFSKLKGKERVDWLLLQLVEE